MILRKCWEEQNPLQIVSAVASALAIVFMVLGLNLLGDGLRDRLDPRIRVVRT